MPVSVIEHPVPGETQPAGRTRQGRRRYTVHSDGPGFPARERLKQDPSRKDIHRMYSSDVSMLPASDPQVQRTVGATSLHKHAPYPAHADGDAPEEARSEDRL